MTNSSKSKLRLLYLERILEEDASKNRTLPIMQLIDRSHACKTPVKRKGAHHDLETLKKFGLAAQICQRNAVQCATATRDFALFESTPLATGAESYKILTHSQPDEPTTNLTLIASDHERALPDLQIHMPKRITSKKGSVFERIDILRSAMHRHKKAAIIRCKFNLKSHRKVPYAVKSHKATSVDINHWGGRYPRAWNDAHERTWPSFASTGWAAKEIPAKEFEREEYGLLGLPREERRR